MDIHLLIGRIIVGVYFAAPLAVETGAVLAVHTRYGRENGEKRTH